jgi:hypothetical protein
LIAGEHVESLRTDQPEKEKIRQHAIHYGMGCGEGQQKDDSMEWFNCGSVPFLLSSNMAISNLPLFHNEYQP